MTRGEKAGHRANFSVRVLSAKPPLRNLAGGYKFRAGILAVLYTLQYEEVVGICGRFATGRTAFIYRETNALWPLRQEAARQKEEICSVYSQ